LQTQLAVTFGQVALLVHFALAHEVQAAFAFLTGTFGVANTDALAINIAAALKIIFFMMFLN
jgi:ethanolamine utilization microcompartment shell protein EutL